MTEEPKKFPPAVTAFTITVGVLFVAVLAAIQMLIWIMGDVPGVDESTFPEWLGSAAVFAFIASGPFAGIVANKKNGAKP